MSIVNLTGFNFSGKGAVAAILRGMEPIKSFQHGREFEMFRLPGGFIDLDTFSDTVAYAFRYGYRNFRKLAETLVKKDQGYII